MNTTKRDYISSCVKCEVHTGFYNAEQHILPRVMYEVGRLSKKYGTLRVKTTGHSLGGALANLTAMDLVLANVGYDVSFYNFGQPRVGNKAYAAFCD